jgi:hypothetical protein
VQGDIDVGQQQAFAATEGEITKGNHGIRPGDWRNDGA